MDCIFCKIIEGLIPSEKIYEDDLCVAFYDIEPQTRVHALIVPRGHIPSAAAITEHHAALLGHIWTVIPKLAEQLGVAEGFRVVTNSGADAGQTVAHLHFHLQSPK